MLFTERYKNQIAGVLSCFDRLVITGTLPTICHAKGMASFLFSKNIRIFDYPKFAEPLRDEIRANAEQIAKDAGISIEFIRKSGQVRKEALVQKVLEKRGNHSGLVHIISVMESCPSFVPWHDKVTHKTFLKGAQSKCVHYYFYFIDEVLGLCYVRVPTWCPFRLQFYCNGHNWLASKLKKKGIGFLLADNAFAQIDNWNRAQKIADKLKIEELHERLKQFAERFCPVYKHFGQVYHWSIMQAEYATDIVFKRQQDLEPIYSQLITTAIHTVKPDNISTFLGKKLSGLYEDEIGNSYNIRHLGSRIKHQMGKNSIKMYDKFGQILRIETTTNDVSFFKHYRKVEHRDGTSTSEWATMKKNIYSLNPLKECLYAANQRYLEFISTIEDNSIGTKRLHQVTRPQQENDRNYGGFNFFLKEDSQLFDVLARGEFNISGFRNKELKEYVTGKNTGQVSRILKRLRIHGLIKKVTNTYKYYLTKLGKVTIVNALKVKELFLIPHYCY